EEARLLAEGARDVSLDAGKGREVIDPALQLWDVQFIGIRLDVGQRHLRRIRRQVVGDDVPAALLERLRDAGRAGEEVTDTPDVRQPLNQRSKMRHERPL